MARIRFLTPALADMSGAITLTGGGAIVLANHIGRIQSASAVPSPLVNGGGELGVLSCLILANGMNRLIG